MKEPDEQDNYGERADRSRSKSKYALEDTTDDAFPEEEESYDDEYDIEDNEKSLTSVRDSFHGGRGSLLPTAAEEGAGEEVKKKISENFFYDYLELVSMPHTSPESNIPLDFLILEHSFGYDCKKRANLQLLDHSTVMYIAGNQLVLLDIRSKEQIYLQSSSGQGIGAIGVHPHKTYFTVAEKGSFPKIIIYAFPSLRPYRILRDGTERAYAYVDFNSEGTLLASVGSDPDYTITIWNWKEELPTLRTKAFSQEVFKVTFNPENDEQLTTAGLGHIKFWEIALTFTGLKLQGSLGRFGKTSTSDIEGYMELPDGKGFYNIIAQLFSDNIDVTQFAIQLGALRVGMGNLLLWDGSLIKVEFCRTGMKSCHQGPINQIMLDEGEVITAGADGCVRIWDFETIDTADVIDDTGLLEIEPINELQVDRNVNLFSMIKMNEIGNNFWLAQDSSGAIWKLDLSFSNITQDPECLFSFHSGGVEAMAVSPLTYLMATTALDCSVRIYDFASKTPLVHMKFKQGGTSLTWVPQTVNSAGAQVIAGFQDGVVRILELYDPKGISVFTGRKKILDADLHLRCVFKPHTDEVTALAYQQDGEILATGSKDKTVFFFDVEKDYRPIGYINTPGPVRQLAWSPETHGEDTLLIICENGYILEAPSPTIESKDDDKIVSYEIHDMAIKCFHFSSVKSKILRLKEIERREKLKALKEKEREARWRKKRAEEREEYGEEELLEEEPMDDDEEEEEEEPLPKSSFRQAPLPSSAAFTLDQGSSGFHCVEKTMMFCGLRNGAIRVYLLRRNDLSLDSLQDYWHFNVHDNNYGCITNIVGSFDDRFLVTAGADSNIFVFSIFSEFMSSRDLKAKVPSPGIENARRKREYDKLMKEVEVIKAGKREQIKGLRNAFLQLLSMNKELPKHMQFKRTDFDIDGKIHADINRRTAHKIQQVEKELAWEKQKYELGLKKLQNRSDYWHTRRISKRKEKKFRPRTLSEIMVGTQIEKTRKLIQKAERAQLKILQRKKDWEELYKSKPDDDYEDPKDVQAIKEAQVCMGDFNMKTAADYKIPEHMRINAAKKEEELGQLDTMAHEKKRYMNKCILSLRDLKLAVVEEIQCLVQEIKNIQSSIPTSKHIPIPQIPEIHPEEVPEKRLQYDEETLLAFKRKHKKHQDAKSDPPKQTTGGSGRGGFLKLSSGKERVATTQDSLSRSSKATTLIIELPKLLEFKKAEPTDVEVEIMKREEVKHLYMQQYLVNRIGELITTFDAEFHLLRHRKLKLDTKMKLSDLHHVTLFQEMLLLKNFEKQENILQERVNSLDMEEQEMQWKINETLKEMEENKTEITKLQEQEKALYSGFQTALGENNKFENFLMKVLKKKIKRVKKRKLKEMLVCIPFSRIPFSLINIRKRSH